MPKQKINTDPKKIDEILTRGVHTIYTSNELREKLLSGKQLHLKLGTDVTGPLIHLGHTVVHRKLRDFQELGHKVTLIIGDFTTLVGDHSDKVDMRKEKTTSQIKIDELTYKEQFFKTVMKESTTIRHNSEWLKRLNFNDVVNLAKLFTVQQMLDREAFKLRFNKHKPIGIDEWLYPLMQGYDSVALKCDVELGGTDQTFNLLAGRKIMPAYDLSPQSALVTKLLTGSDSRPMGKSLKNFIPVSDLANDMYGKLMSIVDTIMWEYFELVTRIPLNDINEMKKEVENGANPMEFKKRLAYEVVRFYHGESGAQLAEQHFEKTVQKGESTDNIPELYASSNIVTLHQLVKESKLTKSSKEAQRLIEQGGVSFNNMVIKDKSLTLRLNGGEILKVGKRQFVKIVI